MTDITVAREHLKGHSICLCRDGDCITDDGRGIAPMIKLLSEGRNLSGYSAADLIVGKAAAMLFVKAGIREVYGEVMSAAGKDYLEKHGIPYSYGVLTKQIVNRAGDGICPMEKAVAEIDDTDEGYIALQNRLAHIQANRG